jgi:hypothetical protein
MSNDGEPFLEIEQKEESAPRFEKVTPDVDSPFYGVKGWLMFVVVLYIYIVPILFVIRQIPAWIGYVILADQYPGLVLAGLIDTVVSGYLIIWAIRVARGLRDIQPRAVQKTKTLLKFSLVWTIVGVPVSFVSGLSAEQLLPDAWKGIFGGIVGFAIWFSYFSVSKRVKATYPDWNT